MPPLDLETLMQDECVGRLVIASPHEMHGSWHVTARLGSEWVAGEPCASLDAAIASCLALFRPKVEKWKQSARGRRPAPASCPADPLAELLG